MDATMASNKYPDQYGYLFSYMSQYSSIFTDDIAKPLTEMKEWNPLTARFEVDVYFAFLVSFMMLNFKHDQQVWEEMCGFMYMILSEIHKKLQFCESRSNVYDARMQRYGDITNSCIQSGDAPEAGCVKQLLQHILASSKDDQIEADHPLVVLGLHERYFLEIEFQKTNISLTCVFEGGLSHIFQYTTDIRTLSENKFLELVISGEKEAASRVTNTHASITHSRSPKPKPWWQFW
jgi:hypothetical protein